MLTIRAEQMQSFQEAARQRFEQRLEAHLHQVLGIPIPELKPQLPKVIASASEYGMARECDVARYSELIYRHDKGGSVQKLPKEALNILLAYGVEPEEKLNRLEKWVSSRGEGAQAHV